MPNITIDKLVFDPEFQTLLPAMDDEELRQLRDNILADGRFIEPLLAWGNILIDGHNRYDVWRNLPKDSGIEPPRVEQIDLPDREAAKLWMVRHQLGKRNLKPKDRSRFVAMLYEAAKKPDGNPKAATARSSSKSGVSSGKNQLPQNEAVDREVPKRTSEIVAEQTGLSKSTVERDVSYERALSSLPNRYQSAIRENRLKLPQAKVIELGKMPKEERAQALKDIEAGKTQTNGKKPQPAVAGKPVFDDTKIEKAIGTLVRLFDERANVKKQTKSTLYSKTKDTLNETVIAWKAWKKH